MKVKRRNREDEMVGLVGIEPTNAHILSVPTLPICLQALGAPGEIRTLKTLFLRQVAMPIRLPEHSKLMVCGEGFEPSLRESQSLVLPIHYPHVGQGGRN